MGEETYQYRILAQTLEEFRWLQNGYEEFKKNFTIEGCDILLVKKGFFISGGKKLVDISPLVGMGEIQGVRKYSSDSKFNLIGSSKQKWDIQGKEYDYIIRVKRLDCLF